ncbi:glycosyl hydrolase 115 family protein [Sphingomonas sp.]|uniref:glycosyl hydrolase 115 family protein n=1 Tax=Sphingomonas sp. TaxID=28214 RepID=UPI0025FAD280|nr:glycosyl hydrolase 115 family protein [Sphingomonas sp.]
MADWIDTSPSASGLSLAGASVVTAPDDHPVVGIAAADLRRDLQTVTDKTSGGDPIWAGTLGKNPAIDRLVASGKLDARKLKGAWESFVIATIERPTPGVPRALVIAGSDRRGTAYGIYELSRAIGVSPWHWWADVTPLRHPALHVRPGTHRFGPPSVKYRGIFINDEDWGLTPWSATVFEGGRGMGPKTYAKVFELLLRLKANTLWPAMHKISPAFNADPENARLADRYAIVMGSSHAEPMLRNNVGEWTADPHDYDYGKNPEGVRAYWEERARTNGKYESIWTLGMRGIHDSGMQGAGDMPTRKRFLERIFADQRAMLARHMSPQVERVPQVFTPYKEVLDIYRAGLAVPDDVTLMWPDDNFGYIRRFPTPEERKRGGGSGIYYHLSYLGAPLSYLWLSTTPPALVGEEMGRAWDLGARRMWIANVGDIKPAELDIDYFLSLAWDVPGIRALGVEGFTRRWAAENVDAAQADAIAAVLAEHHRLNFIRRPEHLQWWLPGQKAKQSPWSIAEADARLAEFDRNLARLRAIAGQVPQERRDAFFELLGYPVEAAAEANRRFFAAEAHDKLRDADLPRALARGAEARGADARIATLTRDYDALAGGKWRGFIAVEPADGQWKSFRLTPPILPAPAATPPVTPVLTEPVAAPDVLLDLGKVTGNWRRVTGLGRNGFALGSRIDRPVAGAATLPLPAGKWRAIADLIPTYADSDGAPLRLTLGIDGKAYPLSIPRETGDAAWAQAVLDNRVSAEVPATLAAGTHRIELRAETGGVLVEAVRFEPVAP